MEGRSTNLGNKDSLAVSEMVSTINQVSGSNEKVAQLLSIKELAGKAPGNHQKQTNKDTQFQSVLKSSLVHLTLSRPHFCSTTTTQQVTQLLTLQNRTQGTLDYLLLSYHTLQLS